MARLSTPSTSSLSETSTSHSCLATYPKSNKVKYHGAGDDWDFALETEQEPIDVSLVLPHYRARNQPLDHRMNMYVSSDDGDVRVKVCRTFSSHRCAFYLEVSATTSDVTVWLPSDFQGKIHLHSPASPSAQPSKLTLSPGFSNKIMRNVQLFLDSKRSDGENWNPDSLDEVDIQAGGNVSLKMWDVKTSAPEVRSKETLKKIFRYKTKKPIKRVNWDFLLDD
jgi:hypothetical protein